MPLEPLPQFKPGDDSLIKAAVANRHVDAINALLSLTVSPADVGSFVFEKGKSVLDLSKLIALINALDLLPEKPETGTWFLACVDGELAWIESEECEGSEAP